MSTFIQKIKLIWEDEILRNRVLVVLGGLLIFRLLSAIPVPGVDVAALQNFLANNQFLGLLNIFSGGGLSNLSIMMLGVSPYITASIIMQLLTIMVPSLKAMYHEEGEAGRKRFSQYSRLVTVPIALIQGFSFIMLLEKQGVIPSITPFEVFTNIIIVTAGALLLMWIGELMTEFGIGNGTSLLIFGGIVASLPTTISQLTLSFDPSQIPVYIAALVVGLIVIFGVVIINEAERPVPVTYAKQVRGGKVVGGVSSSLPLKINQSGVMPIIFAISVLIFPQLAATFFASSSVPALATISATITSLLSNQLFYGIAYFVLVVLLTYFYTAVTFEPHTVAENLQKGGAFIPGIRPGKSTEEYVGKIVTRITLFGALFLGVIAILPYIMQGVTGIQALTIGGTSLLIVVSVVIDLVKKMEAQITMREY